MSRTGKILDGFIELEKKRIRKFANVVKAALRAGALLDGNTRFPQRGGRSSRDDGDNDGGGRDPGTMPAHEFTDAIHDRVFACDHRMAVQMTADVVGKLPHRTA